MSERRCTWKDCQRVGAHAQTDRNGGTWAVLCPEHHVELEQAIESLDPKKLMRAWVLAQGGAKKAAQSMTRSTGPR